MASITVYRLVDGAPVPDTSFDPDDIPSPDQAAALDNAPNSLSATNPVVDKQYVDALVTGLDWQESVEYAVEYVKTDAGAPSGTATSGETCLNTNEAKLYTYTSSWDAGVAVSNGDRFVHKDTGDDTSGNSGTHTKSDKIYQYNGATFDETAANEGMAFWAEDENAAWIYNGTNYVTFGGVGGHNTLAGLQGGTSGEYYHLTSDQYNAVNAADTPTTTNKMLVRSNAAQMPAVFTFSRDGGMGQSQTDLTAYLQGGRTYATMPRAGYIVAAVLYTSSARSAGTLNSQIQKNGTDITPTDLDLQLDGSNTTEHYASVAYGTTNYDFAAGDDLSVDLDTDGSWATTAGNESVTKEVHVAYV